MDGPDGTVRIGPESYASWRKSSLGATTEALEARLILDLAGDLSRCRVLDAGCGDGALACAAAALGAIVTGVDPDPSMLAAARSRVEGKGIAATFIEGSLESLTFQDSSFDVVVAVTVLCFVGDAAGAMREIARVLRPNGRLVIGELGRHSIWAGLRRLRGRLGSSTWRRARFRTGSELWALMAEAEIEVQVVRGAVFYPPIGPIARLMAPVDPWLGRHTTVGAAFIAAVGTKRVTG
ncbi:MAG: class I SAM-dependent methyltransferase [Candidatus Limnocylindrales bacterium]|jgi:SAM-dependent methyltransferase